MLGLAWSQVGSLTQIAILSIVFSRVVPLGIPDYPVFLFVGVSAWALFSGSIEAATGSVVTNRDLVRRPGFPLFTLPLVAIGSPLIHYLLTLPVLLGALLLFTGRVPATALLLPIVLAVQLLVTVGPAYVLAAAHVSFRDVGHLVGVVLSLLFYATPIIYNTPPHQYRLLFELNPLTHLMAAHRAILLEGRLPELTPLVVLAVVGVLFAVLGYRLFVARERWFSEEL